MSCSSCLRCRKRVPMYEKYCKECEKTHKQDYGFWDRPSNYHLTDEQKSEQIEADKIVKKLAKRKKGE